MVSIKSNIADFDTNPQTVLDQAESQSNVLINVDAVFFGENGIFKERIDEQPWAPLSKKYLEYKQSKGYSEDIWIRTGDTLKFIMTLGNGQSKALQTTNENGLRTFKIEFDAGYASYPNGKRPLFFVESEQLSEVQQLLKAFYAQSIKQFFAGSKTS